MAAIITTAFLKNLPPDPEEAEVQFLELLMPAAETAVRMNPIPVEPVHDLLEGVSIFSAWLQKNGREGIPMSPGPDHANILGNLRSQLNSLRNQNTQRAAVRATADAIKRGEDFFATHSGELFCYEFSEPEIEEIQRHLDTLKDLISGADELEPPHKKRLLRRLEQLRAELNKTVSDLDRFWGLIGDARVVIQKIKKDNNRAQKTLNTIWLIAKIVFTAQQIAHQLPPHEDHAQPHLLLPPPSPVIEEHSTPAPVSKKPRTTVA